MTCIAENRYYTVDTFCGQKVCGYKNASFRVRSKFDMVIKVQQLHCKLYCVLMQEHRKYQSQIHPFERSITFATISRIFTSYISSCGLLCCPLTTPIGHQFSLSLASVVLRKNLGQMA